MRWLALCAGLAVTPACAHDFWSNGEPVPKWVKTYCCGPSDVHHLRRGAVHIRADGYHIDGLEIVIPIRRALPSMDGDYWAFWSTNAEPTPPIYCFFAPVNGA